MTASWTATATPAPNAPSVAVLSASCEGVSIAGEVAGSRKYLVRVENAPIGAFVGVSTATTPAVRIMDKIGCRRQSELVHLLATRAAAIVRG